MCGDFDGNNNILFVHLRFDELCISVFEMLGWITSIQKFCIYHRRKMQHLRTSVSSCQSVWLICWASKRATTLPLRQCLGRSLMPVAMNFCCFLYDTRSSTAASFVAVAVWRRLNTSATDGVVLMLINFKRNTHFEFTWGLYFLLYFLSSSYRVMMFDNEVLFFWGLLPAQ